MLTLVRIRPLRGLVNLTLGGIRPLCGLISLTLGGIRPLCGLKCLTLVGSVYFVVIILVVRTQHGLECSFISFKACRKKYLPS